MVDTNLEHLQADSQRRFRLDYNGGLRVATGLNMDANGIARQLFGQDDLNANNEGIDALVQGGLLLDGTATSYAETADAVALDIVGDIDIRVEAVRTTSQFLTMTLLSKWTPAAQQSYRFSIFPFLGVLLLHTSTTGANQIPNQGPAFSAEPYAAFRGTLDVNNGAAGRTARFYTGPNLDGPWTEMAGSPIITAAVTTIFSSTSVMRLGGLGNGTEMFEGRIHRAQVRNGIDGAIVANPDFRNLAVGTTSFVDSAGLTWNLGAGARVV